MGSLSIGHWVLVLLVVVLLFGTSKLRNLGKDLGTAVKGFKEGLQDSKLSTEDTTTVSDKTTIDPVDRLSDKKK